MGELSRALDDWRPGQPFVLTAALRAAARGDEAAERYTTSWQQADRGRKRIAAALGGFSLYDVDDDDGRTRVRAVTTPGDAVVIVGGRLIREDWIADPQRTAAQLAGCGRAAGLHSKADGTVGAHPLGCTSPLCPQCATRKAAVRSRALAPVFLGLHRKGYQLLHLTLTQPAVEQTGCSPTHLTDYEQRLYAVPEIAGDAPGTAVPGEPLGSAVARLRAALTLLRDGRASREWWRRSVAGYAYGIEWTGRKREGDRYRPRWHVHAHLLLILRPDVPVLAVPDRDGDLVVRGPWWNSLCRYWAAVTTTTDPETGQQVAADPAAQLARPLSTSERAVKDAVREVLKYPFKPCELTNAQLAEVLATTKGNKHHNVGGGLHASSRVGKAARMLAADEVPTFLADLRPDDRWLALHLAAIYREEEEATPAHPLYRALTGTERATWQTIRGPDGHPWNPATLSWLVDLVQADAGAVVELAEHRSGEGLDAPRSYRALELLAQLATWRPPGEPPGG